MPPQRASTPPALRQMLQQWRAAAGLTQAELAARLGWGQGKVAKIESGRTLRPDVDDVLSWAAATDAAPEDLATALALASQSAVSSSSYYATHARGLAARQAEIREVEEQSTRIRTFFPTLVPGVLQTAAYARRVLQIMNVSGQIDIDAGVAARVARQEILPDPARRWDFLLAESAFRWQPDGPEVMIAQAEKIINMDTLPNVSTGVVPAAAARKILYLTGFIIYDSPGYRAVNVELMTAESDTDIPGDVDLYVSVFDELAAVAVYGDTAAALIRSACGR
jgi:transcriptional regulator with XRE-family HTH domain